VKEGTGQDNPSTLIIMAKLASHFGTRAAVRRLRLGMLVDGGER